MNESLKNVVEGKHLGRNTRAYHLIRRKLLIKMLEVNNYKVSDF